MFVCLDRKTTLLILLNRRFWSFSKCPIFDLRFPTLAQMGEDLACVLDKIDARSCIAFGEGAGANIICRFALNRKFIGFKWISKM